MYTHVQESVIHIFILDIFNVKYEIVLMTGQNVSNTSTSNFGMNPSLCYLPLHVVCREIISTIITHSLC